MGIDNDVSGKKSSYCMIYHTTYREEVLLLKT